MKPIVTGTLTALLIAATTTLAMAQMHQPRHLYNSYGGYGAQSHARSMSPASPAAGAWQER